jgi:hypothetical protein
MSARLSVRWIVNREVSEKEEFAKCMHCTSQTLLFMAGNGFSKGLQFAMIEKIGFYLARACGTCLDLFVLRKMRFAHFPQNK